MASAQHSTLEEAERGRADRRAAHPLVQQLRVAAIGCASARSHLARALEPEAKAGAADLAVGLPRSPAPAAAGSKALSTEARKTALFRAGVPCRSASRCAAPASDLVAPVELAGAAVVPETGLLGDRRGVLGGGLVDDRGCDLFRARPDADVLEARVAEVGLDAVHRLLDAGLLLALEERVVAERVVVLVAVDRHRAVELRIALLQSEVVFDHLREQGRGLYRHEADLRWGLLVLAPNDNGILRVFPFRDCEKLLVQARNGFERM